MDTQELSYALEALIISAGQPQTRDDLKRHLRRFRDLQLDAAPPSLPTTGQGDDKHDDQAPQPIKEPNDGDANEPPAPMDEPPAEGDLPPKQVTDESSLTASEALSAPKGLSSQLDAALGVLQQRWHARNQEGGFCLMHVADGWVFRTQPRFSAVVAAMKAPKVQRLSKRVMETLAIVAYKQPCTKPEVDDIRGVDSGATLKILLERDLVCIVGKKDEPGRPLLYGSTPRFLSHFSLSRLCDLPSLREVSELQSDLEDHLAKIDDTGGLEALAKNARQLALGDMPNLGGLNEAMRDLDAQHQVAKEAFRAQGILLDDDEGLTLDASASHPEPTQH